MSLRAIVIGAGYAGEGHTIGLREAGVEVAAMCGRTPEQAHKMANKLGISEVRFDWHEAIEEFQPDIVSIATPAPPHHDIAVTAAEQGCHVACDKPLALTAEEARAMLLAVERAGVKHAYVTSHQYLPIFNHARELLSEGLIGQVREIEFVAHGNMSPLSPYGWNDQLNLGGGAMYNIFTGMRGILKRVTGAEVIAATGEARNLIDRAPIGPEFHDMRETGGPIDREVAEAGEWGEVDADQAFTVLLELRMPGGHKTSALIQVSFMAPSPIPLYLAYYGTEGAIHLSGSFMPERLEHFSPERESWEEIPVPQRLFDAWGPHHETRGRRASTRVQRNWNQFFSEFIADVRGEGVGGYETFREGWLDNEIIDGVRSRKGWTTLPQSQ